MVILLKIYIKASLLIFFSAFFLSGLLISVVENLPVLEGYKIMWEVIALKENPFVAGNPAKLVIKSFIFISNWFIIPVLIAILKFMKENKVVFKIIMDNKPNLQFKVVNDGILVANDTEIKLHKKILCIYVDGRKIDKKYLEGFQSFYSFEYEEVIKMYPIGSNVGYDHYDIQPGGAVIVSLNSYLSWKVTEAIAKDLRGDKTITITVIAKATLKITSGIVKKQKSFKYKHTFSGTPFATWWALYSSEVKNLDFIERALFSLSRLGWCPNKIRASK